MRGPLYIEDYSDERGGRSSRKPKHAAHLGREVNWSERLPAVWKPLTVAPIWVDVNRDADSQAERWVGYDEDDHPCLCRYRFTLSASSTGVSEAHSEDLTAWRMRDGRWLIHRIIHSQADGDTFYAFYAFSESMPR
jgi:hypothetical protein